MIITLIGFMGCGKSSVGRELARLLCCPFMDLDEVIEASEGRSIPEIFASDGEAAFRRMETEHLQILLDNHDTNQCAPLAPSHSVGPFPYAGVRKCQFRTHGLYPRSDKHIQAYLHHDKHSHSVVVALGGGTVMTKECAEMVREKTVCVYLKASVETLAGRLADEAEGRPLLAGTSLQGVQRRGNLQTRIEELMALRSGTYEQTAHMAIDTDGKSVEEIVQEIYRNLDKIS